MGSSFGKLFTISTFGESHGSGVGVVIDGCLPGMRLDLHQVQNELDRRRPGQSSIVSQRNELDQVEVLSGLNQDGVTLGTPIALMVRNTDARPKDYSETESAYRPSHADYTYEEKYGLTSESGGGRASARETIGRVAAGAVAKQILGEKFGVEVLAWVQKVHNIIADVDPETVTLKQVESTPVRCPDPDVAERMIEKIEAVRKQGDSVGGVVQSVARNVPAGWGEPVFDKLEADLAKAVLSLPACKGFESGSGFAGTDMTGSQHNDPFRSDPHKRVYTTSNHSGGIQGGISNGMPILIRAAFKPTATILHEQDTVSRPGREDTVIKGRGRHDACVLPRAVPMVEAMMALVLVDHALRHRALTER